MVLRDSFTASDKVKIIMLACVCPGSSSADHTLNTLRYAERLKERSGTNQRPEEQALPLALKRHATTINVDSSHGSALEGA